MASQDPAPPLGKCPEYEGLTKEQEESVCNTFNFGELIQCVRLPGGLANANYRLETSTGNYMLKICQAKSIHELEVFILFAIQKPMLQTNRNLHQL